MQILSPAALITGLILLSFASGLDSIRNAFFDEVAPDTLRQVHVLVNHGERAPSPLHKSHRSTSASDWPSNTGELTKEGLRQHDLLGRWFRTRYDNILDRRRNQKQVRVTSTDSDRTLNSAQANLAGLYYNSNDVQEDRPFPDMDWEPLPVHTTPQDLDTLLFVDQSCPAVRQEEDKLLRLPLMRRLQTRARPLFPLFTRRLGFNVTTLTDISNVYENLVIQVNHNMNIPDWLKPHLRLMEEVSRFCLKSLACTPQLKKLRGGPLLSSIGSQMLQKASGASTSSLFMYSAHQSVLAINLQTVRAFDNRHPPDAAAVIYELHQLGRDNFVVRMMYHTDPSLRRAPLPITVSGCGRDCPLPQWRALLAPYVAADYGTECRPAGAPGGAGSGEQEDKIENRDEGGAVSRTGEQEEKIDNRDKGIVLEKFFFNKTLHGHGDVFTIGEEPVQYMNRYGPVLLYAVLGFFIVLLAVVLVLEVAACTFCRASYTAYVRI